jgi:hypothetical protein
MRKLIFVVIYLVLLSNVSADSDLKSELMPTIEEVTKSLDSDVSQQEAHAAAEARELEELFKRVEAYFALRGDAADAVGFAQASQGIAAGVAKSVEAHDYDAASTGVSSLVRSCKSCHEAYRK